jgi:hypothetical protein
MNESTKMVSHSAALAHDPAPPRAGDVATFGGVPQGAVRPRHHDTHHASERNVEPELPALNRLDRSETSARGTKAELARWEDDGGATLAARAHSRSTTHG